MILQEPRFGIDNVQRRAESESEDRWWNRCRQWKRRPAMQLTQKERPSRIPSHPSRSNKSKMMTLSQSEGERNPLFEASLRHRCLPDRRPATTKARLAQRKQEGMPTNVTR